MHVGVRRLKDPAHAWILDPPVTAVTFIKGRSCAEVLKSLGAQDRAGLRELPTAYGGLALVDASGREMHAVSVTEERGGWTALVEPNGFAGQHPAVLGRLSAPGVLVSYYRSVNADMQFVYAEGGVERRRFDPLLWPDEQWGEPLTQEAAFVFGYADDDRNPSEEALLLVEVLTGIKVSSDWLTQLQYKSFVPTDPS